MNESRCLLYFIRNRRHKSFYESQECQKFANIKHNYLGDDQKLINGTPVSLQVSISSLNNENVILNICKSIFDI